MEVAPRDSFEARFTPPRAGTFIYHSYRLRIINITLARPGLRVAIRDESSLVRRKLLARDGAELSSQHQREEPADRALTIGQTIDVELEPQRPGTLRLTTAANVGPLGGTLEFRVSP